MKTVVSTILVLILVSCSPVLARANQFINIVNPIRISKYNPDPMSSLKAQYRIISNYGLPATWLLTYDVLENSEMVSLVKQMDAMQEVGIFLEVTANSAAKSGVSYHDSGDWHYANSVLLSGYSRSEREVLINRVFEKFKELFGHYPSSIGSWWTDAYSLQVIKSKYPSVVANLTVADQFKTDGYQVWGQYWAMPYYPSRGHPAVSATSVNNKLDLVTIQWAPRDPYRGYLDSLYSTQDYFTAPGQKIEYFSKLVELYASKHNNQFGQITVGLEGDFPANVYAGHFLQQMNVVKRLTQKGNYEAVTMSGFSDWYRKVFPDVSPEHLIVADDLLDEAKRSLWFQSPKFRLGLVTDLKINITKLVDLRIYSDKFEDPYYFSQNGSRDLFINIPSSIDQISKPGSEVVLDSVDMDLVSEANWTELASKYAKPMAKELVFRDLSIKVPYSLRSRMGNISNQHSLYAIFLLAIILCLIFKKLRLVVAISIISCLFWAGSAQYYVSTPEVEALNYLSTLPPGSVVVYDKDCLRCIWETPYKPAAMANRRGYVEKIGKHNLIYNNQLLTAQDAGVGKLVLKKQKVKYLYLVKYGTYIETTHFSPSDLNLSKVFENSNAQLWMFNESHD